MFFLIVNNGARVVYFPKTEKRLFGWQQKQQPPLLVLPDSASEIALKNPDFCRSSRQ